MTTRRCRYICTPMALLTRRGIPHDSPVWWRYQMCLARAWEETGGAYAYFYASNRELADLWHVEQETARKGLAELVKYRLVEAEQVNQRDRIIRILVAWRGQGQDSAPEPRFRVPSCGTNEPEQRAPRLAEHQAPAAGVPTRPRDDDDRDTGEGGKQTTTLSPAPNTAVAVGLFMYPEIVFRGKTATATAINITRTREERDRILDALDDLDLVDEAARDEILSLRHVTPAYVEDWLVSFMTCGRDCTGKAMLGPGYYRQQMRERRRPAYEMTADHRRDYRAQKDLERQTQIAEADE